MYDIIFIGNKNNEYRKLKERFPTLKQSLTFERAQAAALSKFFWVVWEDVIPLDSFNFDYTPDTGSSKYVHTFKNGLYFDGISLIPKNALISQKEITYRFFRNKKEVDILASSPIIPKYDVVFISYNEPNANKNYEILLNKVPTAIRVQGIKGIHQAHIAAANLCTTDLFYVVDGDAIVLEHFNFNYQVETWNKDAVHVWRSCNPINDLEYGYGGVKLLPRKLTIDMNITNADMTTSISSKFKAMDEVSNVTAFNTDEFSTWRSAFRECCKLASKTIRGQDNEETDERLARWCSSYGRDRMFGDYAISGARAGRKYGNDNFDKPDELKKINDFDWLYEQFSAHTV
jgi:hypothetical protein